MSKRGTDDATTVPSSVKKPRDVGISEGTTPNGVTAPSVVGLVCHLSGIFTGTGTFTGNWGESPEVADGWLDNSSKSESAPTSKYQFQYHAVVGPGIVAPYNLVKEF